MAPNIEQANQINNLKIELESVSLIGDAFLIQLEERLKDFDISQKDSVERLLFPMSASDEAFEGLDQEGFLSLEPFHYQVNEKEELKGEVIGLTVLSELNIEAESRISGALSDMLSVDTERKLYTVVGGDLKKKALNPNFKSLFDRICEKEEPQLLFSEDTSQFYVSMYFEANYFDDSDIAYKIASLPRD